MQASAGRSMPIGPILAIVGGALLAIGSFLAWVTLSGGGLSETASGIDGSDGYITLVAGVVAIATGGAAMRAGRRALAVLAIVAGLVGGGVGLYDALSVRDQIADEIASQQGIPADQARAAIDALIDSGQLDLSMGIGLYVVIAGGAIAIVGGVLQMAGGSKESSMPAAAVAYAQAAPAAPAPQDVAPPSAPPAPPPPPDAP